MPCYVPEGPFGSPSCDAEIARIKKLEALLCSSCRVLERKGYDFDENPALSVWWDAHKRADAAREAEKRRKRNEKKINDAKAKDLLKLPAGMISKTDLRWLKSNGYL